MQRIAVVTGANKGIGYAIVRGLAKQFDGIVYLTARNVDLGSKALSELQSELGEAGKKLRFHQLDITDGTSAHKLSDHIKNEHGGLDILVNNAGIAYKQASTAPVGEQAENTIGCNYFGTKTICQALFPILRPHARRSGLITKYGAAIKERLTSTELTYDKLDAIMNEFIRLAKEGTHSDHGFAGTTYGMSKAGEIALTFLQQKDFDKDSRADIVINACCPGYVDTDMTSHKGHLTIDQGADTPLYLALLPLNTSLKGQFVAERNKINWNTA